MKRMMLALLLATAGCGGETEEHEHGGARAHEGEHGEHAEGEEHAEQVVRIDPGMLRDLRVTTAPSEARAAGETVDVLGELGVNQNAYAEVATPGAARILEVMVDAGARVTEGQPLVALSSADVGRARGDLQSSRARADLAERTLARKRALLEERLVPEREVQEAEAAARTTAAELAAAQSAVGAMAGGGGGGARLVLRAPLAGVVIARDAVKGQLAEPSHTLFRIGDLSRLWVEAHVFERDAVRVKTGSTARVTLTALPGRSFSATVALVGHEVEASSRTIPVRLELDNPDGLLRPGMTATVHLPLGDEAGTVVTVPLAAVQRVGETWCVFVPVAGRAGQFEIRVIGRGRELGGEVEALRGLAAGETVVVDGAFLLKAEADKARGEGGDHDHH